MRYCCSTDSKIVDESDGVKLIYGKDARPTGEAFVEFYDQNDMDNAFKMHKKHIGKRYIEGMVEKIIACNSFSDFLFQIMFTGCTVQILGCSYRLRKTCESHQVNGGDS